jgi:exonuclease SbcD
VRLQVINLPTKMQDFRIIFFADTHLGFDYPVKPRLHRRRRGLDFFENFHRVLDYARQTRPDALLHGGDVFFRARVPQRIVDMVYSDLFEFAAEGIPLLIVPGNHERSILPASLFLGHPNIHVFDHPRTFAFEFNGSQVTFSGFPCQRKNVHRLFSGLIEATGWSQYQETCQLLCLHQTIEGARIGPAGFTFRWGEDVIPRSDLPRQATAVLSGHIHRQQVLSSNLQDKSAPAPVIYPGSIERTSFAERDEEKGFYEIIFSNRSSEKWLVQQLNFHPLPARPMLDVTLEKSLQPGDVAGFIQAAVSRLDPGAIIRLRCDPEIDPQTKSVLTSSLLREILPDTMNYQFSSDFHQWKKES